MVRELEDCCENPLAKRMWGPLRANRYAFTFNCCCCGKSRHLRVFLTVSLSLWVCRARCRSCIPVHRSRSASRLMSLLLSSRHQRWLTGSFKKPKLKYYYVMWTPRFGNWVSAHWTQQFTALHGRRLKDRLCRKSSTIWETTNPLPFTHNQRPPCSLFPQGRAFPRGPLEALLPLLVSTLVTAIARFTPYPYRGPFVACGDDWEQKAEEYRFYNLRRTYPQRYYKNNNSRNNNNATYFKTEFFNKTQHTQQAFEHIIKVSFYFLLLCTHFCSSPCLISSLKWSPIGEASQLTDPSRFTRLLGPTSWPKLNMLKKNFP